jgi:hypothetical protein
MSQEMHSIQAAPPTGVRRLAWESAFVVALVVGLLLVRRSTWGWPLWLQVGTLLAAALVLFRTVTRPWFRERYIGGGTATQLGWVRVVVCASLQVLALRFDITKTLFVPISFLREQGPLGWLFAHVPLELGLRNLFFLSAVRWIAVLSLACGMIGLFTRPALVIAAVTYTVFYYVQIAYTHFFHNGFLPLQLLYTLCFLPCADGLAIDARKRPEAPRSEKYGVALFTCVVVYGLTYFVCGMSKWFVQPFWATGENLLRIFVIDSPVHIDHLFGLNLIPEYVRSGYPHWVFTPLAWAGILIETSAIFLLFRYKSWRWIPLAILGLHLGIYLGQKFTFVDCVVLTAAFVDIDRLRAKLGVGSLAGPASPAPAAASRFVLAPVFAALILAGWVFSWETFPIASRWAMYAGRVDSTRIFYTVTWAIAPSGKRFATDLTDEMNWITAPYWRDVMPFPNDRNPRVMAKVSQLLTNYATLYGADHPEREKIDRFEFDFMIWDYGRDPKSATYGEIADRILIPVSR